MANQPQMERKMNNKVMICYCGGSGGHFIAALCEYLLFHNKLEPTPEGSYHVLQYARHLSSSQLLPQILTAESIARESQFIENLSDYPLNVSILRNVALLELLGWKVIYITYRVDQVPEIRYRHDKKRPPMRIEDITEEVYNMLKGNDWPTWEQYKNGATVDELHPVYARLVNKEELLDWFYILPPESNNICEIKFDEILRGYTLIDKLISFLNINDVNKNELKEFVDNYRSKQ
jgi:hypothetical protein